MLCWEEPDSFQGWCAHGQYHCDRPLREHSGSRLLL